MEEKINVRDLAADTLAAIDRDGQFCHIAIRDTLDMYDFLPVRDKAFLTRLVSGTVERMIEIDHILDSFSKTKISKQKPMMRAILRSAVYQIRYMDSVPDSAACNEAVKLASKRGFSGLKGYVNAVLRNAAGHKEEFAFPESERYSAKALSITYSMPEWIVERFTARYGPERCESILGSFLGKRPVYVWADEGRMPFGQIKESLLSEGVGAKEADVPFIVPYQGVSDEGPGPVYIKNGKEDKNGYITPKDLSEGLPGDCKGDVRRTHMRALELSGQGSVAGLSQFKKGLITVQDISSMAAVALAAPSPGDFVLDVCAAPGGKSLHAAALLRGTGHVQARDISREKAELIIENKERCHMENLSVKVHDALKFDPEMKEKADIVIADLPCSGLGVIGRKPDIKYRVTPEDVAALSRLQQDILRVVCRYVKPGGKLIYSTCTVSSSENEENVASFLASHSSFELEAERQFLPDEGCDGFFAACLRRH